LEDDDIKVGAVVGGKIGIVDGEYRTAKCETVDPAAPPGSRSRLTAAGFAQHPAACVLLFPDRE
jgi:hypothetical protein